MIYAPVAAGDPIRQGDIIRGVPRVDISLQTLLVLSRDAATGNVEQIELTWHEAIEDPTVAETPMAPQATRVVRATVPVAVVDAIVISQDCDAARDEELSLCEIGPLPSIWAPAKDGTTAKWYAKNLTRQGTEQIKCFYLPEESAASPIVGFNAKMAVDFSSIIRLPRTELESTKSLRKGRLNDEAYQHFREKLSEYFRRYPVDPWYSLNAEEFRAYNESHGGSIPARAWQI